MRFSQTSEHSRRHQALREAYAAHDAYAEAGDDGAKLGGTTAADEACEAYYVALDTFLFAPSLTATEMQEKIQVMRQRGPLSMENLCWNEKDMTTILDRMELDLIGMFCPNTSPLMSAAFVEWANAQEYYYAQRHADDAELDRRGEAVSAARRKVVDLPCTTPGDFIAKAFVDLINEIGGTYETEGGGAFLPDMTWAHPNDQRAYHDIADSDLGCCMLALGRTDFDAKRWVEQALLHGKSVNVIRRDGERRGLSLGLGGTEPLAGMLQRLTANGLGKVSSQRCEAIANEIEANHPDLVIDAREAVPA